MTIKKVFLTVLKTVAAIIRVILVYLLFVFTLPLIPVRAQPTAEPKNVEIFIFTNGAHTDLVLPVVHQQTDWRQLLPYKNIRSKDQDFKYVGIGWGDKGFYLDTPTWADLKFSTAVKAAFWLSESAMHCTYYKKMATNKDCKRIMISERQYADLVKFIKQKFDYDQNNQPLFIKTNAVYGDDDAFYEAKGKYSFLDTCNTWTNNGLKAAGQKAAIWTALDFGIFWHYE